MELNVLENGSRVHRYLQYPVEVGAEDNAADGYAGGSANNSFQIFVSVPGGPLVGVSVRGFDLLERVFAEVERRTGIACRRCRLVCSGRQLVGNRRLSEYGLRSGHTLHVIPRLLGGAPAQVSDGSTWASLDEALEFIAGQKERGKFVDPVRCPFHGWGCDRGPFKLAGPFHNHVLTCMGRQGIPNSTGPSAVASCSRNAMGGAAAAVAASSADFVADTAAEFSPAAGAVAGADDAVAQNMVPVVDAVIADGVRGCGCGKSACAGGYCGCRRAGRACGVACRCGVDCGNAVGPAPRSSGAAGLSSGPRLVADGDGLTAVVSKIRRFRRAGPLASRIPKSARSAAAERLTGLLKNCAESGGVGSWCDLFQFACCSLELPERRAPGESLTALIKRNVKRVDIEERAPRKRPARPSSGDEMLKRRVEMKMDAGDVTGAGRLMSSTDAVALASLEVLAALKAKHPAAADDSIFPEGPVADSLAVAVSAAEVKKSILAFPKGSAGGFDGLTPQHLKDMLRCSDALRVRLCEALAEVLTLMLRGAVPELVCRVLYGATLTALVKKDGGIRPIAVGNVVRRLACKVVCQRIMKEMGQILRPFQLGFGTPGGMEAAIHSAWAFCVDRNPDECCVLFKSDWKNAFNAVRRDKLLEAVVQYMPEYSSFVWQMYRHPSELYYDGHVLSSESGVQQGDPLGPLLFSLVSLPIAKAVCSPLNMWYLDDGTFGGPVDSVLRDYAAILAEGSKVGLELNSAKCEVYVFGGSEASREAAADRLAATVPDVKILSRAQLMLLGSPLTQEAIPAVVEEKRRTLRLFSERLAILNAHQALFLVRCCYGVSKVLHIMRTSRIWLHPDQLKKFDDVLRDAICAVTNVEMTDAVWDQASLPVRFGGLGVRRTAELALPAYLASVHAVKALMLTIFPDCDWLAMAGPPGGLWCGLANQPVPGSERVHEQSAWDVPLVELSHGRILASLSGEEKARLLAVSTKESGCWLNALPSSFIGTLLDNDTLRVAVALRLGAVVCYPHKCLCGAAVDAFGRHGLRCRKSRGRLPRHVALNDIICRGLVAAGVPSILEPPGLARGDVDLRPDGVTQFAWKYGKQMVWDATCVDTLAHLGRSIKSPGAAAEDAEREKSKKYAELSTNFIVIPIGVETFGSLGPSARQFLRELGRRIALRSGEPLSMEYLLQRFSLAVQRGNAASVLGTREDSRGLDEVFYLLACGETRDGGGPRVGSVASRVTVAGPLARPLLPVDQQRSAESLGSRCGVEMSGLDASGGIGGSARTRYTLEQLIDVGRRVSSPVTAFLPVCVGFLRRDAERTDSAFSNLTRGMRSRRALPSVGMAVALAEDAGVAGSQVALAREGPLNAQPTAELGVVAAAWNLMPTSGAEQRGGVVGGQAAPFFEDVCRSQLAAPLAVGRWGVFELDAEIFTDAVDKMSSAAGRPDDEFVRRFHIPITRRDFRTLYRDAWLNDEICNFYFELIRERSEKCGAAAVPDDGGGRGGIVVDVWPKIHIFSTHFFSLYASRGYDHVQRWAKVTRRVDLFALDLVLMPVNVSGVHWAIIKIDFRDRSILYYDSMGAGGVEFVEHARAYIEAEYRDQKKSSFDFTGWRFDTATGVPRQTNGFDCGVFMCRIADCLAADQPLCFTQNDVPFFRIRMACEILKQKLYTAHQQNQPVGAQDGDAAERERYARQSRKHSLTMDGQHIAQVQVHEHISLDSHSVAQGASDAVRGFTENILLTTEYVKDKAAGNRDESGAAIFPESAVTTTATTTDIPQVERRKEGGVADEPPFYEDRKFQHKLMIRDAYYSAATSLQNPRSTANNANDNSEKPQPFSSDNVGCKMLKMMNWQEGRGLGARQQGMVDPQKVEAKATTGGRGFGINSAREDEGPKYDSYAMRMKKLEHRCRELEEK